MDVGSQPDIVGEVPAVVVGIFVDDNVIAVPEPIPAEPDVVGCDAEVETAEPEAAGTASSEMPDVAAAETAGEVTVLPGVIDMVVRIVAASVVTDPLAVGVDMRSVGMAGLVGEVRGCLRGCRMGRTGRSWAVRGNVPCASADFGTMLGQGCAAKQNADCEKSDEFFHVCPFFKRPGRL